MKAFELKRVAILTLLAGALMVAAGSFSRNGAEEQEGIGTAFSLSDSTSLLGSYLAGRLARNEKDLETAAEYYRRALERDPDNETMLSEAFQLELSAGNLAEAASLARRIVRSGEGDFALAYLLLGTQAFHRKEFGKAIDYFSYVGDAPVVELTAGLAKAWSDAARGKTKAALTRLAQRYPADRSLYFQRLHTAFIADLTGDKALARKNFRLAFEKHSDNRRLVEAYVRHAAHWGERELAKKILKSFLSDSASHPVMEALSARIEAGAKTELLVTSAQEGLAEVFFGIGAVLAGSRVGDVARIYLHLARLLVPDHDNASYLLGEIETAAGRHEAAIAAYDSIAQNSSLWIDAHIRKAFLLSDLKRHDEAITTLKPLVEQGTADKRILQAMGNVLRDNEKYAEAAEYYSRAIELIDTPSNSDWVYFYSRGICYERLKLWEKAEVDLRKALELNPDQPAVLNYLGYSWVDQNLNLDEAMELIRKAVRLKPNNGYFVDSLGWAHYRLANFEEAVRYLERAVELRPEDPVINDHLGDAYWRVGRQLEARYQWSQTLGLDPEPELAVQVKRKLEHGLEDQPATKAALKDKAKTPPADAPRAAE